MLLLLNTDCRILHCVTVYVQPRNVGYNEIHRDNEVRLVFMNIEVHCVSHSPSKAKQGMFS